MKITLTQKDLIAAVRKYVASKGYSDPRLYQIEIDRGSYSSDDITATIDFDLKEVKENDEIT